MRVFLPVCLALLLMGTGWLRASPEEDLASPDQAVRDKAAAELRTSYVATPESRWTPVVERLKPEQTQAEVDEILAPFQTRTIDGPASGGTQLKFIEFGDDWQLVCWFRTAREPGQTEVLSARELERSAREVWVNPPKDFTGKWVLYFTNGQKSHEIPYRNGVYFGDFVAYHYNGAKAQVIHYTERGMDGESSSYFPTGKLMYRGRYEANKPVGKWVWYDKAGNVAAVADRGGK